MTTREALTRRTPLIVVLGFAAACLVGFVFLYGKAGGSLPLITSHNAYEVSFASADLKNLKDLSDVRIAGVDVGQVESRSVDGDEARVVMSLDPDAAPLHEGATVRVGVKSLVGSSYIEVLDGKGKAIEDGDQIPSDQVVAAVDVDELFNTFDEPTQEKVRGVAKSLGSATRGTGKDLDQTVDGLGRLGDEGATVLDALADQSDDLEALTREATVLLEALDTGRGQIATLVGDADTLTGATAGKSDELKATMRSLPELLTTVRTAAVKLQELSGPLTPVANDLQKAAPDLNAALVELPAATRDLRGLLPDLDATLGKAPATLKRVPATADDISSLVPETDLLLRDVNPMLEYLAPYGTDVGSMFANFGASMNQKLPNGLSPLRLSATVSPYSVRGNPVTLPLPGLSWNNPYPAAGGATSPQEYDGTYPRIKRDPK
jgi:phospholipid/cholesterol/gamma-HCH transport system substrate-binding protein